MEHFDACDYGFDCWTEADYFNLAAFFDDTAFYTTCRHCATSGNGKDICSEDG
jgi:hypothetical protein